MNITQIKDYSVKSGDVFFFDTNVWMCIFGPLAGTRKAKQKAYSNLLKAIQTARASIFVSSLILAEYVNACLQISFKMWKRLPENVMALDFKRDYRGTEDYRETLKDLKGQVRDILQLADRISDSFNAVDVVRFFDMQDIDFNDAYYIELCNMQSNKIILVTDDKDILNSQSACIQMLTAETC